jgi:hypothetical protein
VNDLWCWIIANAQATCLLNPASVFAVLALAAGASATVTGLAKALKSLGGATKDRRGALAHHVAVLR